MSVPIRQRTVGGGGWVAHGLDGVDLAERGGVGAGVAGRSSRSCFPSRASPLSASLVAPLLSPLWGVPIAVRVYSLCLWAAAIVVPPTALPWLPVRYLHSTSACPRRGRRHLPWQMERAPLSKGAARLLPRSWALPPSTTVARRPSPPVMPRETGSHGAPAPLPVVAAAVAVVRAHNASNSHLALSPDLVACEGPLTMKQITTAWT